MIERAAVPPSPIEDPGTEPASEDRASPILLSGRVVHAASGVALAGLRVEAVAAEAAGNRSEVVLASGTTDEAGTFMLLREDGKDARIRLCVLECDPDERLVCRVLDGDSSILAASAPLPLGTASFVEIEADRGWCPEADDFASLAEFVIASRRVRVREIETLLHLPPTFPFASILRKAS